LTGEEEQHMKAMNPKSPAELAKEEQIRRFLQGDDSPSRRSTTTIIIKREKINVETAHA
jgi:hypothetical protein